MLVNLNTISNGFLCRQYSKQVMTFKNLRLIAPSSGMLRSVGWLRADVSGLPVSTIFKGKVSTCPLKMEPIGSPETSGLNLNTPEDGRSQVNCSESLLDRNLFLNLHI
jgi:hypothetical protein